MTTQPDDDLVLCRDCNATLPNVLPAERQPCPKCGSTRRALHASMFSTARVLDSSRTQLKRPGVKGYIIDERSGSEYHRDSGTWRTVERVIDKGAPVPWYRERIVDPATGQVIREMDQPLADHQGRGTARPKGEP